VHTASSIHIRAPREKIFAMVSDLARWPLLLPHYREIDFLGKEADRAIVRMKCVRSGLPLSWVASYRADAQALELRFEHLRSWTKGMQVVWTLNPTRDGTRVEIVHNLQFRVPALAWLAEPFIGGFFIRHVARRTLQAVKEHMENPKPPAHEQAEREAEESRP
jgi:ribosome-associated toxin RatA of RatAB toxin-antitoxin module